MTEEELQNIWTRWMHRNDLQEDLDTVYLMASTKTVQRLLLPVLIEDLMTEAPRIMVHAGLIYLHQLARDDAGQRQEMTHFEDACQEYSLWKSRDMRPTVDPFSYGDADGT